MKRRPRIVQCSREIAHGGGVSGVAAQLEVGFRAAGYECDRVTLETVGLSPARLRSSRFVNKLFLIRDILWYTVVGTLYARVRYSGKDTVVICHNDSLFGDIYVNHGLHKLVVRGARGGAIKMILRNPLHLFILVREEIRHRFRLHNHIVTLSKKDTEDIGIAFPSTQGRVVQLSNGVDVARFAAAAARRPDIRRALDVLEDEIVLLFVGHEFDRKGLQPAIEALSCLDRQFILWVVGGSESMISNAKAEASRLGVADRARFFGTRKDGVEDFFGASDVFVLPSKYEAASLALLEAMAAGAVPVATPVGAAPDFIQHGVNGLLVEGTALSIAAAVRDATETPERLATMSKSAAESAHEFDWPQVVQRYLELIETVHSQRRAQA
jgi:glycosyltransferase involved in cell wall biosynthesis